LVNEIIAELRLASPADLRFTLSGRSIERHRAEIRELLGFREATVADSESVTEWLQHQTAATGANAEQLTQQPEGRAERSSSNRPPPTASIGLFVPQSMRTTSASRPRSRGGLVPKPASGWRRCCVHATVIYEEGGDLMGEADTPEDTLQPQQAPASVSPPRSA